MLLETIFKNALKCIRKNILIVTPTAKQSLIDINHGLLPRKVIQVVQNFMR